MANNLITFYRLKPGAGARPMPIATIADEMLDSGMVFQATAGGDERLLAITTVEIPRPCSPSCPDSGGLMEISAPHILWTRAPA